MSNGEFTSTAEMTIIVADVNEAPAALSLSHAAVAENVGQAVNLAGGEWTYAADNSQAAIQALAAGEMHIDSFTITQADYNGFGGDTASIDITINGTNSAPILSSENLNITENQVVTGNLLDNDRDPEGDALTVIALTVPSTGRPIGEVGSPFPSWAAPCR